MEKILILNGSPRAPKSNSKLYAGLFSDYCPRPIDYAAITRNNHLELCAQMEKYTDVLLVFPLYADALPVGLLNFLKSLEKHPPRKKPVISVLINCGFLEAHQNDIAIRMLRLFCRNNGYETGSVLKLGSGEAILQTPFRYVAKRSIRKLAKAVASGRHQDFSATMPLTRKLFLWASTVYWTNYGKKFGITKQEMQRMDIESPDNR